METTVLGYPQIGPSGELKLATEAFWAGRETCAGLTEAAAALRRQVWETLRDAGLSDIPSNTFSLYDHVLDTAVLFNAVPERFAALEGLDAYFAMARGADGIAPLELTKWLNTDYCYLAPELGPKTDLRLAGHKPLFEYLQARSYGVQTRPVLLGPLSFLLLSKPAEPGFSPLDLLDPLLDAYAQLLEKLHKAGAEWVQLDEPALAADRTAEEIAALGHAYHRLGSLLRRPVLLVSTSSGEIGDALPVLAASPVEAIGLDFVAGPGNREALAAIGGIGVKTLVAGVIDGRNAWRADLPAALSLCASLFGLAGNLIVSASGSLLNEPLGLAAETALPADLAGRLALARETVDEVVALGRALSENDAFAAAVGAPYAIRLPFPVRHGGRGRRVGRAHRPVVGGVGGPGLASVRVHLLIRVEPVVAPVGGRLAAQGAGDDLRAWDGDAVALGPPDPDPDHDRERGNVNDGHQRGDEGQVGAHLDAVLRGSGQGSDAGPARCTVQGRETPVQLLKFAEAHAELRHDRGRDVERLLAQRAPLLCQVDAQLPLVVGVAGPSDQVGGLQALQHRRQRRAVKLEHLDELLDRQRRLPPQRQHHQVLRVSQSHRLQDRPVDAQHAARGDRQGEAHLALQRQRIARYVRQLCVAVQVWGVVHDGPIVVKRMHALTLRTLSIRALTNQ